MDNIKLGSLLMVFFQRTIFFNPLQIKSYIKDNINYFSDSIDESQPIYPISLQFLPLFQLNSITTPFKITVYNNRIDLFTNTDLSNEDYFDCFNRFIELGFQLAKLSTSKNENNLCCKFGVVNNSYIEEKQACDIILNNYIKKKISNIENNISISYTQIVKIDKFKSNKVDTIESAFINNHGLSISLKRDINIKDIQNSIDCKDLISYIKSTSKLLSKDQMLEML